MQRRLEELGVTEDGNSSELCSGEQNPLPEDAARELKDTTTLPEHIRETMENGSARHEKERDFS